MALTAWSRPLPVGQLALAAVGGVWAPGYAALAVAYPRGRLVALERHALAFAAGLLLLPVVGLAASELVGFRAAGVAGVLLVLTATSTGVALRRRGDAPEPASRSAMPGTRATLVIAGACLLASALLVAASWRLEPAPSSLSLAAEDGGVVPAGWASEEAASLVVTAAAGTEPARGTLTVTWDGEPMISREIALEARGAERIVVVAPSSADGVHILEARWDDRVVRAHVTIGSET